MKLSDYLILAAIACWLIAAVVFLIRNRKKGGCCKGCSGNCSSCRAHCSSCEKKDETQVSAYKNSDNERGSE